MNHKRISQLFAFFIRHLVASIVSVVAAILVVVVAYFALIIVAILDNSGFGGPFALPFGAATAGIISLLYTACLLFPAVFIAELVSRKLRSHQAFAQALISTTALAALIILITFALRQIIQDASSPFLQLASHPAPIFLALCIPLGLYWWVTKVVQEVTAGVISLCKKAF